MVKQLAFNLVSLFLGKPLPLLSTPEKEYLEELRREFREQPVLEPKGNAASEAAWVRNMNRLRQLVLERDPRKFLRWDVVRNTMFVAYTRYISLELQYLTDRPEWRIRWQSAIEESPVGYPIPYIFYRRSSGNLIHHAYHLAQFEDKSGVKVDHIDVVVEFGGGYGSMCRLFYKAGFSGKYVIFDLKPFSLIQRYYLRTIGLQIRPISEFSTAENGVFCITDIEEFRTFLTNCRLNSDRAMFVATWSISETPLDFREIILSLVSDFAHYLIAYQNRFEEVDNEAFFGHWMANKRNTSWHHWKITHIPGSYYLVGTTASEPC